MPEKNQKTISIQNDSFYEILTDILKKDRVNSFDAYQIKVFLIKEDLLKATNVDKRVIEYVYNNLKDWHTLVTNVNACKMFLLLNETSNNFLTISKKIKINRTTVRYWVGNLYKLKLIISNDFQYGREKAWRKDDQFEKGISDPNDFIQEDGLPKDKFKLQILKLTAYFCTSTIEQKVVDRAKKTIKEEFSFLLKPRRKEDYV